jgi:Mce-associated membrane protein
VLKLDDANMADNDVAVAPRLQRVPEKKAHRKERRKTRERGLRVGRPSFLVAGLTVLAVLLAAAAGYLGWSLHNDSEATAQRASILTAARQEAAALTTLSSTTGAKDYDAVLAGSAGNLKEQLSAGRKQFLKTLGTAGVSSVGTVLDAGIVSVKSGTATVLIDVKASVRNKQTDKPEQRAYHWQASLVSSDGKWLVTSLEFV